MVSHVPAPSHRSRASVYAARRVHGVGRNPRVPSLSQHVTPMSRVPAGPGAVLCIASCGTHSSTAPPGAARDGFPRMIV